MDGNTIHGKKDRKHGKNSGIKLNNVYVCSFCVFDAFGLQMMELRPRRSGRKLAGRVKGEGGRCGDRAVCEELRHMTRRVSLLILMPTVSGFNDHSSTTAEELENIPFVCACT